MPPSATPKLPSSNHKTLIHPVFILDNTYFMTSWYQNWNGGFDLFGVGNVAVGVLPPEVSSEMKRNFYSTRFRFAVQLSDGGGSRIFIGERLQVLGAPFWLLKGRQCTLGAPS